MKRNLIKRLTFTAMMMALSTALSFVKVSMPLGGSITLLSMVPMCSVAIIYGTPYAIIPCLLYGGIQAFISNIGAWGLSPAVFIGCLMLDYVIAFGTLCLSGLFRKRGTKGIIMGICMALISRFICHFLSGIILFRSFDVFNNPYLYSFCYNAAYMIPELAITLIGVILLIKSRFFERFSLTNKI